MDKNLRRAAYAVVSLALVGILVFRFFPHLVGFGGGSRKTHTAACDKAVQDKICQNYNKCTVKVHLPNCGVDPEVVPADLPICEQASITWELTASGNATGAKFAANGIEFRASDGGTAHYDTPPKVRDITYEYKDKHKGQETDPDAKYKYSIHVLTPSQPNCVNYDPFVYNE